MASFVLLGLCLGLGVVLARWGKPPDGVVPALNWWILTIALPALTMALVPSLHADRTLWFLVAPQWLGLVLAAAIVAPLGRRWGWPAPRIGAVILLAGLANTSFMGYPLLEALRGAPGLQLGVVADQVGAFVALAVGGIVIAAAFTGRRVHAREVVRRVVTFPPFLGVCAGLVAGACGGWPGAVHDALVRIGATLSPLALFSVGLRLKLRLPRRDAGPVALALGFRLVAMPALAYGLGRACGVDGLVLVVGVLQAGMAPMISAAIVAEREGLDAELATTTLALGILASLVTVPLLDRLFG